MVKCSNCKYAEPAIYVTGGFYFWCKMSNEYIEECIAEDENMGCELADICDDITD